MTTNDPHGYIGRSVTRLEDARLLTGAGEYVDDVKWEYEPNYEDTHVGKKHRS